jgi:hypothetical protein
LFEKWFIDLTNYAVAIKSNASDIFACAFQKNFIHDLCGKLAIQNIGELAGNIFFSVAVCKLMRYAAVDNNIYFATIVINKSAVSDVILLADGKKPVEERQVAGLCECCADDAGKERVVAFLLLQLQNIFFEYLPVDLWRERDCHLFYI